MRRFFPCPLQYSIISIKTFYYLSGYRKLQPRATVSNSREKCFRFAVMESIGETISGESSIIMYFCKPFLNLSIEFKNIKK